jgi:hypothetical protein
MGDELEGIVQRMIDAGEPEDAIASVIQAYPSQSRGMELPKATPGVLAAAGAARMGPAILSGVNTAANMAAKVGKSRFVPAAMAVTGLTQLGHGDFKGAATTAAMSQVPRAARGLARMTGAASPVGAGVGWLSRIAGKAALPLGVATTAYDGWQMIQQLVERQADPSVDPREREAILQALQGSFVN